MFVRFLRKHTCRVDEVMGQTFDPGTMHDLDPTIAKLAIKVGAAVALFPKDMSETITVRALVSISVPQRPMPIPVGELVELPTERALQEIEAGRAKPELLFEPYPSKLPPDGLPLGDALKVYLEQFPRLAEISAGLDEAWPPDVAQWAPLRAKQYAELPQWKGMDNRTRRKPTHNIPSYRGSLQVGAPLEHTAVRFLRSLRSLVVGAAIHFFFKALAEGKLAAKGVSEGGLPTLPPRGIDARWWPRDIELNARTNEIHERAIASSGSIERRWSDVVVLCVELPKREKWPRRGPKSPMDLVNGEFERMKAAGELPTTRKELAEILHVWLKLNHPAVRPLEPKTINNKLGAAYKQALKKQQAIQRLPE